MSKKSVFKFTIGGTENSKEVIDLIITKYLEKRGFIWDKDNECYMIGYLSEEEANISVARKVVTAISQSARSGYTNSVAPVDPITSNPCFEYEIVGNNLIIKACVLNPFSSIKSYIHVRINTWPDGIEYYDDLQNELFKELEQNNVILSSVETEKVKDGSTLKALKKAILIVFVVSTKCLQYN